MAKATQKRIIVSVTTDLVADNRVHKVCSTLVKTGFGVLLVGRKLPDSLPIQPSGYKTKRIQLLFRRGPAFYAEYNFRLFCLLLRSKHDVLLSNDLDTLPANYLVAKIRNKPLVYDSHEFFTEMPELINRPFVKRFWEKLEHWVLPKIKYAYTVCDSIAAIYHKKYGVPFMVVRNVPFAAKEHETGNIIHQKEKIILYQGAVNVGRGLKQAILAMENVENARLVIAGKGDILDDLKVLVKKENLYEKVTFTGRLTISELAILTPTADLGLSIEEDLGLNYRYTLPNKLFDYIQARVPVLVTNLPEMTAIIKKYKIGEITRSLEPKKLAEKINSALLNDELRTIWKENLKIAANELTWENEEKIVINLFSKFL